MQDTQLVSEDFLVVVWGTLPNWRSGLRTPKDSWKYDPGNRVSPSNLMKPSGLFFLNLPVLPLLFLTL